MSVDGKTKTHTIVHDLTALSRKPAGSVTPDPGARIPDRRPETWPVVPLPANGKSSSQPESHSYGLEHGKSVSASNDPYIGVRKCSRSSALPGSGDLRPGCTNQLRGVEGMSAAFRRRSNVGRPISDGKSPRLPLPPGGRGLAFRLLSKQISAPHAAELHENRSQ